MADTLPGYPQAEGSKLGSVIEKAGPASYTAVTPGAPPTGGQVLEAKEFGLKYLESVTAGLSADGAYTAFFTPTIANKNGVTAGILLWMTAATGVEVVAQVALDTIKVRLRAIGLD